MKHLRKFAGISVLIVFIFMIVALFGEQEEDVSMLPDQFEYFYDVGWSVSLIEAGRMDEAGLDDPEEMKEWILSENEREEKKDASLPYAGTSEPGDCVVFQNTLPSEYAGLTLNFPSANCDALVILDGEVVFWHTFLENAASEKSKESHQNFVDIPNVMDQGNLLIALTSPYPDAAAALSEVKIETRDVVVIGVVGNHIADIGCCLLIEIMAIIMFVLAMIRRYTGQPARGELFLGLAGAISGIYCFIETDTLSIFYNVHEAYEMQEYLVLLVLLFLGLYFDRNMRETYPRRFTVLLWCVIFNAAAQILLHMLGVRDMWRMMNISAFLLCAVCMVALASLIQYNCKSKGYRGMLSILAIFSLLAGGVANVILNRMSQDIQGNLAGQYSMVAFGILTALAHTLQLSKEYRAGAEENARLLQEKVHAARQQNMQLAIAKQDADAARHEALAANEAKGKFLARMSHEIRTPINAVLGMDEMILRESSEQNVKDYAMDIYMAGQTLLSLINDILDFSKIESGKMEIVPVEYDVSSMIHDLANMTLQRAKEKDIKLELEIDPNLPSRLFGDDVRIRQVLTNILTNAVKYTQEGTIWLRIFSRAQNEKEAPHADAEGKETPARDGGRGAFFSHAAAGADGPGSEKPEAEKCARPREEFTESEKALSHAVLVFEVEDTGIGIREEDLPKLSAEFERIEEEKNRNIEGTGLGMSITIQLLSLLGSRLNVESVYGRGSKFSFELKQRVVDGEPVGDFESRARQLAQNFSYSAKVVAPDAKILVVDDNAVNRKVLRNLLKETRIQVTEADGGEKCLELVMQNHYDLIFLDHMMPEMDGVETLRRFRELSDFPCEGAPVVVLTANAVSGAREKYLADGFDDFLSKPVVPEKLEQMIRKMLPEELIKEEAAGEGQKAGPRQEKEGGDFTESLPFVDGLDWQYAWLHLPDPQLLEYALKEFYGQIGSAAQKLEQEFEQAVSRKAGEADVSLANYRVQAHAMKGLAATVGILPLAGMAKILEFAAKDGNIERIESVTPVFLEEWRGYHEKLQGVFGIEDAAKKTVTDFSVPKAFAEMARLSMQEMDIDRADAAVGELRSLEYPEGMSETVQRLADAVTNLDAEEAARQADLLIGQMEAAGSR